MRVDRAPALELRKGLLEGEGWGEGGCLGEAATPKSSTFLRAASLHPLQGERPKPSTALGEGSSAHPPRPRRGFGQGQTPLVRRRSCSLALEGEGWGEGGCLGEAARPKSSTFRQGRPSSPSPGGESEPAPDSIRGSASPAETSEGPSARGLHPSSQVRTQSKTGRAVLHPLQGERLVRPSSAETGEGSSGQPASGYARVS